VVVSRGVCCSSPFKSRALHDSGVPVRHNL